MHLIKDENGNHLNHSEGTDKTLALMNYMLEHNGHHADELAQIAEKMTERPQIAEMVKEAVEDFRRANEKLEAAVKLWEGVS